MNSISSKDEKFVIKRIEKTYMKDERQSIYMMLENAPINWYWDERDIEEFDKSYSEGMNLFQLAEKFRRTEEEIVIMIIDRALQDKIGVLQ